MIQIPGFIGQFAKQAKDFILLHKINDTHKSSPHGQIICVKTIEEGRLVDLEKKVAKLLNMKTKLRK